MNYNEEDSNRIVDDLKAEAGENPEGWQEIKAKQYYNSRTQYGKSAVLKGLKNAASSNPSKY
jgi:hypothetical protein